MTPERWGRIKSIFEDALDAPPAQRAALVHAASQDDTEIESEVLRLLQAHATTGDFLEQAAAELHTFLPDMLPGPALAAGMILCRRFQVRRFLNSGGMGEVYEAWDTELDEAIALKTILPHIAARPSVIDRFKREVRHAREVSHPNICRVHELFCDEDATGERVWFLTMELLRGSTLLERVRQHGPLPCVLAQPIAEQLLDGLQAAHARGLVHRDFKSANIILVDGDGETPRAVITDFGLAVGTTAGGTSAAVGGTPGYMAPEQARGEPAGPLADQYAFGVVLCEMMTGTLPRLGRTGSRFTFRAKSRIGSRRVTHDNEPQTDTHKEQNTGPETPKGYPAAWPTVIRRCTQAAPADRFPDMAAVESALAPGRWKRRVGWLALTAAALAASVGFLLPRHSVPAEPPCIVCDINQLTPDTDKSESPSLSADGRFIAYSSDRAEPGNLDIFVQALPTGPVTRVTTDAARDTTPSLSPDGKLVAFRSERQGGGIFLTSMNDPGTARLVAPAGRNPKFSPDGKSLVYWTGDPDSTVQSARLFRLPLGGNPQPLAPGMADARYPVWHSSGSHVLFQGCGSTAELPPDCADLWIVDAEHGGVPVQTHAYATLRAHGFLPSRLSLLDWQNDRVLFSTMGATRRLNLAAVGLSPAKPQAVGTPGWLLSANSGDLDPSAAGDRLAFTRTTGALHVWRLRDVLGHHRNAPEKVTEDTDVDSLPSIAEGGRWLAFARGRTNRRSVIVRDMSTGAERVVVDQGTAVLSPIVDPSGRWLAFQQTEPGGGSAIYSGEIGGAMRRVCTGCTEPSGWFHDGRFFFRDGAHSIALADAQTGLGIRPLQRVLDLSDAAVADASWSPATSTLLFMVYRGTGKHVAAVHLDPATAKPDTPLASLPAAVTAAPQHPRWLAGGRALVYTSAADGFLCLYQRTWDPVKRTFGPQTSVAHFHNTRATIDDVGPHVFNLSASGTDIYLNLGEQNSTIALATLHPR